MKQTITISGEVPVKKNSYRTNSRGGLYKPKKITDFEELVAGEILAHGLRKIPDECDIKFSGQFFIKRDKDLDGMITSVMDALQDGGVYKDDKKVVQFERCFKKIVKDYPEAIITLEY